MFKVAGQTIRSGQMIRGELLTEKHLGKFISFEFHIGDDYPLKVEGILAAVSTFVEEGFTYNYASVIDDVDISRSYGGYNVAYRTVFISDEIPDRYSLVARQFANKRRKTLKRRESKARKAAQRIAATEAVASNA